MASRRLDSARRRRQWRATLWRLFKGMLVVGVVAGLGVAAERAYRSSWLEVTKVTVVGLERLKEDDIVARAHLLGRPILAVDPWQVEAELAQLPDVKQATVERRPPHEVVILIEERHPRALWQVGKATNVVDEEGFVLNMAPPGPLLTIIDKDGPLLAPGQRVDVAVIELAQALVEAVPQSLGAQAVRFEYQRQGGLVVVTDKGWQARFGDSRNLEYKLAVWQAILQTASAQKLKARHVDLRFGTRPFFRE